MPLFKFMHVITGVLAALGILNTGLALPSFDCGPLFHQVDTAPAMLLPSAVAIKANLRASRSS